MPQEKVELEQIKGQGGTIRISADILKMLKDEAAAIVTDQEGSGIWSNRLDAENTRYCIWDGQSADGRKHSAANDAKPVEPFEGACDGRYRLADMLVREDVMLCVLSTLRGMVTIKGTESSDIKYAGNMQLLLRWILQNQLGYKWVREIIKLASLVFSDSPAVALMGVSWRRETGLTMQTLTVEELMQLYVSFAVGNADPTSPQFPAQAEQAAEDFVAALRDSGWGDDELALVLTRFFPHLKPARAEKIIKQLRNEGTAEFPSPYEKYNGPDIVAKQLYEDFFLPTNTKDFQQARIYFEAEWLSKVEVLQRQTDEGWSGHFVEQVIGKDGKGGHEAEATFKEYIRSSSEKIVEADPARYKGLYQLITAYFQAANEDGVIGRYFVTFHAQTDQAATDAVLLDYKHGLYPGHVFQREVLSQRLLDSRGIPETASTNQDMIKLFCDSFGDNAQISGVPPIITRGRRSMGRLYIAPLVELQAKREGDYQWMQPPTYPRTVDNMIQELRRQVDEYYGRSNPLVPPDLVNLHKEFKVMWWLTNIKEVLKQILQLAQQYMPDEMIQRVTNSKGMQIMRSREDIQGQFDLEITFNPRDMDPEYLKTLGVIVRDVLLAMDRDKTILPGPIVATLLWRLAPEMAEASLQDVDRAIAGEMEDEIKNYQMIRAGMEPKMVDDGSQNYPVRLNLYEQMEQANPQVYADMSQDKLAILQARLKHLNVMSQQYGENVQIGRQGTRPALSQQDKGIRQNEQNL